MKKYLFLLWIILIATIELRFEQPIKAKESSEGFSISNTQKHLKEMTFAPHLMGTQENKIVRDYIVNEFEKLNIPTELYTDFSRGWSTFIYSRIGRTENIIARIKGTGNSEKALLIAAHYDSVLRAPGAADDCYAVACMIEVARLMKENPPQNDIIFLITDGEEMGLLGATAYVNNKDLSEIGLMLNYEARGNAGPSIAFEWSDGNYSLVSDYKKIVKRPITNALSFEIYNLLPNDTDYTRFKNKGVLGINHAFIDGFAYYHNPVDDYDHINWNSVQHTGENMYRLTKHYANVALENIDTSQNASFFNIMGQLIIYPANWNVALLAIIILCLIFALYKSFINKNNINIFNLLKAFPLMLFFLGAYLATAYGLSKLVFDIYPQYEMFYSGQFYNHKYYLVLLIGIGTIFQSLFFYFSNQKIKDNLAPALLILLGILAVVAYFKVSTASYALLFPMLSLIAIWYLHENLPTGIFKTVGIYALSIIPIALFTTLIHNVFLAFSLELLIAPTFLIGLLFLSSHIIFPELWSNTKSLISIGSLIGIGAIIGGHLTSKPTAHKPLPLSLNHIYNIDTEEAAYISSDRYFTPATSELFDQENKEYSFPKAGFNLNNLYRTRYANATEKKPEIPTPRLISDSTNLNVFKTSFELSSFNTLMFIDSTSNLSSVIINNTQLSIPKVNRNFTLDLFGMSRDSLEIHLIPADSTANASLTIMTKYLEINHPLPDEKYKWVDGYTGIMQKLEYAPSN